MVGAEHRHRWKGMQEILVDIRFPQLQFEHPLQQTVLANISECLGDPDYPPGLAPGRVFGIHLMSALGGVGYEAPHNFTDAVWEEFGRALPFTREEYEEWQVSLGHGSQRPGL
ncbi:hypothetical protein ACQ3G6_13005 [Allorhizobium undicola]|uniref:hypothetical protein n=1 Tax=Allorhizobium undicola TaxID=78527 RepID=UPI003D3534D6